MRFFNLFNLNDPGWGRGSQNNNNSDDPSKRPGRPNDGPPDLDQVWNDFNKRLKSLFGKKQGGGNNGFDRPPQNNGFSPSPKATRLGIVFIIIAALALWLVSGFYIVREGYVGVVTQFGRYQTTVLPGMHWHMPTPIQSVEKVDVSSVRNFTFGYKNDLNNKVPAESLMLTEDENIVEVQFAVHYRLKTELTPDAATQRSPAADFLFSMVNPTEAVRQSGETAMREIVGKESMNNILYESRTAAANNVMKLMQQILNRYRSGIEVTSVAIQNVQPPEQVQAAFEDAIKAGQDNERQKNEGNAYASKVIPEARGRASRLVESAEGYREAIVTQAKGLAARFESVQAEYAKAPEVTRERIYISTLREVFENTSKVLLDTKDGNNMMYLPIDKILEGQTGQRPPPRKPASDSSSSSSSTDTSSTGNTTATRNDNRLSRDNFDRSR